jgi:hypothetical protein
VILRPPSTRATAAFAGLVGLLTVGTAVGLVPRWPGALHLVALPPLDLAADLRWLLARAPSWPVGLAGLLVLVGLRITVLAWLAATCDGPRWRLAATSYAVATPLVLLAAQLDFVAHAALYSRLFGVALGLLAAAFLLFAAAPFAGGGQQRWWPAWRRSAGAGFRVADLAGYAVVLVGLGALAEVVPDLAIVALVPVSGVVTWLAIARLRAPAPAHARLHLAGAVALGLAAFAVVVVTRGHPWHVAAGEHPGDAIIMSGINSASGEGAIFELEPERVGFTCERFHYFSYAGTGDGQPRGSAACPKREGAPYQPEDTQRPFEEQVSLLAEQSADLEPPITVFSHSQAAWVAWVAAVEGGLPRPATLVLVGPFPSSPLPYPPPGQRGTGRIGGDLLRLLAPLSDTVDFDFEPDAPLARELLAQPDAASAVFARSLPDEVDAVAITATSDLALMPDGWRIDGATDVCPVREAHPYLPLTPALHAAVDRFLAGEPPPHCPPWPELYRTASQAFGAPPASA